MYQPERTMLAGLAFSSPTTLRVHQKRFRPSLSRKGPRCQASPSRKATLFSTGEKLSLHLAPPAVSPSTPRYIICPECASAYVGNAVTKTIRVSCPSCKDVFNTSPTDLYTVAPPEAPPPPLPNSIVCAHMRSCSGCTLSKKVDNPPMLTEARKFLRESMHLPFEPTVDIGPTHNWRTHAKLAVRRGSRGERLVIGLFKTQSHDVIPIPGCAVHAVEIELTIEIVRSVLLDGNVTPYDESSGQGMIRYILLSVERSSRLVQVTLVWNASSWKDGAPNVQKVGAEVWRRGRGKVHSVWINWNTTASNAIVNPEPERFYHMYGERNLVEHVCGVPLTFPPYVFRQANLDAFETFLLPRLLSYIPIGSNVAEFCAGVGVIGLTALKRRHLSRLVASEIHSGAKDEFWKAVQKLRRANVTADVDFIVGSDEETMDIIDDDVNVVIFDPPRGGLSEKVIEKLAKVDSNYALECVIYVSCGFSAFKKDARNLCAVGKWKLSAAHFYVIFPGSDHIETLAVFTRVRDQRRVTSYTRNTDHLGGRDRYEPSRPGPVRQDRRQTSSRTNNSSNERNYRK